MHTHKQGANSSENLFRFYIHSHILMIHFMAHALISVNRKFVALIETLTIK
jgi:hypothetical protein